MMLTAKRQSDSFVDTNINYSSSFIFFLVNTGVMCHTLLEYTKETQGVRRF